MIDRRAFVALFATSAGAPLLAQIQAGTTKFSAETILEAARLAGLTWTVDEARDVADALSSTLPGVPQAGCDAGRSSGMYHRFLERPSRWSARGIAADQRGRSQGMIDTVH